MSNRQRLVEKLQTKLLAKNLHPIKTLLHLSQTTRKMSKDLSKYQDAFFVRQEEKQVANYNDALVDPRTRDGLVPAFAFQFMMKTYDKHLGHDIGRMIFIGSN